MCLITDQTKLRTAKEDITVYKIFKVFGNILRANFRYHYYKTGKQPTVKMRPSMRPSYLDKIDKNWVETKYPRKKLQSKKLIVIGEGYHSALTKSRLIHLKSNYIDCCILKCIIPKGSQYYINSKTNLIVSSDLIVPQWKNI